MYKKMQRMATATSAMMSSKYDYQSLNSSNLANSGLIESVIKETQEEAVDEQRLSQSLPGFSKNRE